MSQLAQDVEALVRRSYPTAVEEMNVVLACNFFIDVLHAQQLHIYVKQADPGALQVLLVSTLEFEAFLKTTSSQGVAAQPSHDLWGWKTKVEDEGWKKKVKMKATSRKLIPGGFHGLCLGCGKKGHKCSWCPRERRTRSLDWLSSDAPQPCCKDVILKGDMDEVEKGADSQLSSVPVPLLV